MKSRRTRTRKMKKTRKIRGGYKQYLSNVGYRNGYEPVFDNTMNSPSAIRTSTNWVGDTNLY
jgi:hypothetical protein